MVPHHAPSRTDWKMRRRWVSRLPPGEKHLLQTAAVIGSEVPLALLQASAEMAEEALLLSLAHLQAAEFLYETPYLPEITYTFKHALTQQVAYETLLQERRRTLHARIVEALEALAGERVTEPVERLAYHALRGEVWGKAVDYCRRAGEKAMVRSAHREAVKSFEQALSALLHLPEQRDTIEQAIDLRLALRSALRPLGEFGRILTYLREAEALAATLHDPRRLGQVIGALGIHFFLLDTYDQALAHAYLERGHEAYALRLLGGLEARRDPPVRARAEAHYREPLTLAKELGMRPLAAHYHFGLGTLYATSGCRAEARMALPAAIKAYQAMEMTWRLPQAEIALAQVKG